MSLFLASFWSIQSKPKNHFHSSTLINTLKSTTTHHYYYIPVSLQYLQVLSSLQSKHKNHIHPSSLNNCLLITLALPTMDAFSLLKFWRFAAGTVGCGHSNNQTTATTDDVRNQPVHTTDDGDEEDSFFDLEFTAPGNEQIDISDSDEDVESPNDVIFEGRFFPLESNSNSKPQSPISFLRSPPKFPVFLLFKKPKLEKTETGNASKQYQQQSKRFAVKCKVEEFPIFSLLARVNSSRSKLQRKSSEEEDAASSKRFAKDLVHKYLNLIKPLYVRVSKRYSEFSTATPSSSLAPLRVACKQLGKSRSVSSGAGIMPIKRGDSVQQQQNDGIQSAILHCKTSYNSSRSRDFLYCHDPQVILPSRSQSMHQEIPPRRRRKAAAFELCFSDSEREMEKKRKEKKRKGGKIFITMMMMIR
ncbi:unnamed protein product [Camellia sinensis]